MCATKHAPSVIEGEHISFIGPECITLYAFALNRRKEGDDRSRAMQICPKIIEAISKLGERFQKKLLHDAYGLQGRIHKDVFSETVFENIQNPSVQINYESCQKG